MVSEGEHRTQTTLYDILIANKFGSMIASDHLMIVRPVGKVKTRNVEHTVVRILIAEYLIVDLVSCDDRRGRCSCRGETRMRDIAFVDTVEVSEHKRGYRESRGCGTYRSAAGEEDHHKPQRDEYQRPQAVGLDESVTETFDRRDVGRVGK